MAIDDLLGDDVDPAHEGALVVFNASGAAVTETVDAFAGRDFELSAVQADGADPVVKATQWDAGAGTVTVPARTVAVLVELQEDGGSGEPGSLGSRVLSRARRPPRSPP
ncbi:alpha-1,6-glucosidase domain-containing protein [Microbacterium sp. NIBRBAC000506063]|uniref:alpha-1,6-glucosidase domain-containing protein n=1 Tax=Microbacterium sp. NIBRBAC000506063 TaxID=2734618 RepID=UPI002948B98D|nr:alpha-1,6-glucosidase domain-containing protein [Microbacterium sp. NIBRBAC000506063]